MNEQVRGYREACEALARKLSRSPSAIQVGAEYDDLVQEGLIDVWQSFLRGVTPRADMIENRMRDYVRWLGSQVGRSRDGGIPYEALLPLDDFRVDQKAAG